MADPTKYTPDFDFSNYQANKPSKPLPGQELDIELANIALSTSQTIDALKQIRRSDGAVKNKTIGYDQLKDELNGFGFNPPSEWETETSYIERDTVFANAGFYRAAVSHISGDFETDLADGKWVLVADFTAATSEAQAFADAAGASAAAAAADRIATGQDRTATGQDRVATGQDGEQTGLDADATAADRVATGQDREQTGLDADATAADRIATGQDRVATAADRVQTGVDRAAAAASAASVDVTSMDFRPSLIVNGSMVDSQENGNTLGTASGYYPADQIALYFGLGGGAMSVQRIQARTLANALDQIEFKTTTAKASLAPTDFVTLTQNIEGSSFAAAGFGTPSAKPLVLRAEVRLPAGLYHFHFANAANNRHCAVPFTISSGEANTPVVKTIIVPADTSGTWLTAEGVIGITCDLVLAAGSGKTGGAASTWGGSAFLAASAQKNILDSTANVARLADVGLKIDPTGAGVYGAYRVNEVDTVYRSQRYWNKLVGYIFTYVQNIGGYTASLPFVMGKAPVVSWTYSTENGLENNYSTVTAKDIEYTLQYTSGGNGNVEIKYTAALNARLS